MIPFAVLTLVPILAALAAVVAHRHVVGRRRPMRAPQYLLVELCRRHGIDAAGERLLKRITAGAPLTQPAEIFVFADRFDEAVAAATSLRQEQIEKLSRIRQQLFGPEEARLPVDATTSFSSCPSPRSLPS